VNSTVTAYIGLGSNLGDRHKNIDAALGLLGDSADIELVQVSSIIETEPLGDSEHPQYLNGVAQIKTTLPAEQLHKKMGEIEITLGRVRPDKWSPRTIDLDLLLFGDQIIQSNTLTVPHRQMHLRTFVLAGLCELNGDLLHPVIGVSMKELLSRLNGGDFAINPKVPQLISVAGIIGVGKTTLTTKLSDMLGCKYLLEPYDKNPFLSDVYAGNKDLALDSQLFFLAGRINQTAAGSLRPSELAVSDYVFEKELIYARRLLDERQLALYEDIYHHIDSQGSKAVLVIYLADSASGCLERIHQRNRPYEQQIELDFLQTLSDDYEKLFADWKSCPVIRLSVSEFDCRSDDDVSDLLKQIKRYVAL
jgi:2-amino-4-hydroxy-6-hydroxymethyldihydropteridine diphosphokinase